MYGYRMAICHGHETTDELIPKNSNISVSEKLSLPLSQSIYIYIWSPPLEPPAKESPMVCSKKILHNASHLQIVCFNNLTMHLTCKLSASTPRPKPKSKKTKKMDSSKAPKPKPKPKKTKPKKPKKIDSSETPKLKHFVMSRFSLFFLVLFFLVLVWGPLMSRFSLFFLVLVLVWGPLMSPFSFFFFWGGGFGLQVFDLELCWCHICCMCALIPLERKETFPICIS